MPRINRRARALAQPRRSRAQVLELLLGPNGRKGAFKNDQQRADVWELVRRELSDEFAPRWYASQTAGERKPFAFIAEQYARQVVAGDILAGEHVKAASRRHLADLDRAAAGWVYEFSAAKAERVCRFLELLPHTKGKWAADEELMELQPWQVFLCCVLFGWIKKATGTRRFSLAYIEVPRKNGKSQFAAGIGLYCLTADGEFGAEIYSGATSEKQAHEVFRPAHQMMERSPELAGVLGVSLTTKKISVQADGSRFEPVVRDPGDGASPHVAIVDEYHEHEVDTLFDTFRTGMGARTQPILLAITTSGSNLEGPCKALHGDVVNILQGSMDSPEVFGIIYSMDPKDDWTSETALRKANPNLDVSVFLEFLASEQRAAMAKPRKRGVFQTKHLCVWVGANAALFDLEKWKELGDPNLLMERFIGQPCVVAIDLSTKRDFTARAVMFKQPHQGKDHYYLFIRLYLPEEQVMRPEAQHYLEWKTLGKLTMHDGATVDFEEIERETIEDVRRGRAREFAFDPWNAAQFAQAVERDTKAKGVEITQNVRMLSAPTKELDVLIAEGRIHHEGNPVLTWMVGNVTGHEDANENVFPRKEEGREENKIDGAAATIMALSRLMVAAPKKSVYSTRGLLTLPAALEARA